METHKDDNEEQLRREAPLLFSLQGRKDDMIVPDGYFAQLSEAIRIETRNDLPPAVPSDMTVPEGYFEGLSSQIMDKIDQGIDQNEAADEQSPAVPEGYFNGLSDQIMERILEEEASTLFAQRHRGNDMKVPTGYFDELSATVSDHIKEESAEASPAKKGKLIQLFSVRRIAVGIAAAIALAFAVKILLPGAVTPDPSNNEEIEWFAYTDAEIDSSGLYFDYDYLMEDETVASLIDEFEVEQTDFDELEFSDEEADEVIDFLMEDGFDDELLFEEL